MQEGAVSEGLVLETKPGTSTSRTFFQLFARDPQDPESPVLKLDFASQSPFRLAPLEPTTEEIRVASFRDLAASKLHAVCDRIEVRDFIDLHAILAREVDNPDEMEATVRRRTRDLVRDVMEIDPGLNARLVGEEVSRGLNRPLLANFPLQVLIPMTETEVQRTLHICTSECAAILAESLQG